MELSDKAKDVVNESLYFIFIRCRDELTERELIEGFGLVEADLQIKRRYKCKLKRQIAIGGEWTLVADNFIYRLWDSVVSQKFITKLSEKYDVYTCWVGDCDYSYGFKYFTQGRLIREFDGGGWLIEQFKISKSTGELLPGEKEARGLIDEVDIIFSLGQSLAIPVVDLCESLALLRAQDAEVGGKKWWQIFKK